MPPQARRQRFANVPLIRFSPLASRHAECAKAAVLSRFSPLILPPPAFAADGHALPLMPHYADSRRRRAIAILIRRLR
jgi:hypothetical protein